MIRPKKRMRLTRKNNSVERPVNVSFTPTPEGVDVAATYQLPTGDIKESISTKFTVQLDMDDMEQINSAFVLDYTFRQFKKDCPELAESCEGWKRIRKVGE